MTKKLGYVRGDVSKRCVLLVVSSLALLSGCDWVDSSPPVSSAGARPGAERQVAASNALPSAGSSRQYDAAVAPFNNTRDAPQIGSIVLDKGGQKAQLEGAAKEEAEHDKAAREERERRANEEAERRAKEAKEAPTQAAVPPSPPITSTKVPPEESTIPSNHDASLSKPPAETKAMPPAQPQLPAAETPVAQPPVTMASPPPGPASTPTANVAAARPTVAPVATIYFTNQSAEITATGRAELARVAKILKGMRQIEIHAYAGGNDPADDRKLALTRALVVRSYLIDLGVPPRMEVANSSLPFRGDGTTEYVDILVPSR